MNVIILYFRLFNGNDSHLLAEVALSFTPPGSDDDNDYPARMDYAISLLLMMFLEASLKKG